MPESIHVVTLTELIQFLFMAMLNSLLLMFWVRRAAAEVAQIRISHFDAYRISLVLAIFMILISIALLFIIELINQSRLFSSLRDNWESFIVNGNQQSRPQRSFEGTVVIRAFVLCFCLIPSEKFLRYWLRDAEGNQLSRYQTWQMSVAILVAHFVVSLLIPIR